MRTAFYTTFFKKIAITIWLFLLTSAAPFPVFSSLRLAPTRSPPRSRQTRAGGGDGGQRQLDQQLPRRYPRRWQGGHRRRSPLPPASRARPFLPRAILRRGGHHRLRRDRPLQDMAPSTSIADADTRTPPLFLPLLHSIVVRVVSLADLGLPCPQANAMRSPQERNTRLENMTWRIWNLARKKKEVSSLISPALSLLYSASSNCSLDGFVATIPCRRWSLAGVA
jgi:hypothetical protein